jgi:hypothetical protein
MQKFEIIEIDPATGDEDQLICQGTRAQMEKDLNWMISDFFAADEWDGRIETYPVYRLQPARG